MTIVALAPMDLAALLCSRVCHDVISPVGAIVNGLEVLEDEKDAEMREVAIELIKKSANAASARLQFCRLAFGAAGSAGATVDTGDAEAVTRGLISNDRTKLVWNAARRFAPKNKVKLLLNLSLIALAAIPRGGVVTVDLTGQDDTLVIRIEAKGTYARVAHGVADLVSGEPDGGAVDAHTIQPFFTGLVARDCGMAVTIVVETESVTLEARPAEIAA
jgi:histidine phosphotransferase ChpT